MVVQTGKQCHPAVSQNTFVISSFMAASFVFAASEMNYGWLCFEYTDDKKTPYKLSGYVCCVYLSFLLCLTHLFVFVSAVLGLFCERYLDLNEI